MRKEDCKKGMIVQFGDDMCRGVVTKVNPKRALVATLDGHKGRRSGIEWRVPYGIMWPVVGGDEVGNEMTMRSFQEPDSRAVKTWSEAQRSQKEISKELLVEDVYIMRAIHEIYKKLESTEGRARISLSEKINILFRAFGREVTKNEAQEWVSK